MGDRSKEGFVKETFISQEETSGSFSWKFKAVSGNSLASCKNNVVDSPDLLV